MENNQSLPDHLSLPVLDANTTKTAENTPDYFQAGHKVRAILTERRRARPMSENGVDLGLFPQDCRTETECLAKVRSFHSIESCFESIDQLVQTHWNEAIFSPTNPDLPMNKLISEWKKTLAENDAEKYGQLIKDLGNLESVNQQFSLRQFGFLEELRESLPEAWLSMLAISSERQMAKVIIAAEWFKYLSEDQIKEFGFSSKTELDYVLLLQSLSGKYVDQAYIKQVMVADAEDKASENAGDEDADLR